MDLQEFERTVSKAYESSSYDNSPHLSKHINLSTFWKIIDNTVIPGGHGGTRSILGSSLTLGFVSRPENDVLSTHLLPEPTRVHSLPHATSSAAATPYTANSVGQSIPAYNNHSFHDDSAYLNGIMPDAYADSPFLAQNFFALGQDFVGNADDWFNWTNP